MAEHVIRLPDVGEGVAEAELVEWHVKIGDLVREDTMLAAVMTDKATVEIPSPVDGEIVWLGANIGDVIAVGSDLVRLKVLGDGKSTAADGREAPRTNAPAVERTGAVPAAKPRSGNATQRVVAAPVVPDTTTRQPERIAPPGRFVHGAPRREGTKPITAPAVRLRAREAGIDLREVPGTGPAGRITHDDLDAFLARGPGVARAPTLQAKTSVEDMKVVGLRRKIAERMALANSRIPHITYVDEIDVTGL